MAGHGTENSFLVNAALPQAGTYLLALLAETVLDDLGVYKLTIGGETVPEPTGAEILLAATGFAAGRRRRVAGQPPGRLAQSPSGSYYTLAMDEWLRVLSASLAVFGVVGVGAWLRRMDWLTADADRSLLKLVVNVLMPALILRSVVGNAALDDTSNVWLPPVVGFGTTAGAILVCGLIAWWLGPALGLRSPVARRTFAVAAGMHNYGYLPVPLAESLYGTAGEATNPVLGVLFVNNVGVDLAMWTLGVAVISGAAGWNGLRRAINAPSLAVVAALLLHSAGAGDWMPARVGFVWQGLGMLAACAVPVALLLIGATVVDAMSQLRGTGESGVIETANPSRRGDTGRLITAACLLRLGLLPLGFIGLSMWLPTVGGTADLQRVVLLHAAMPAAVFPIILARHYQGDPRTAAIVSLSTSALSLITMPIWLMLGPRWLGL